MLLSNDFEGITPSGTTVSAANSGGTGENAFTSVSLVTGGTLASSNTHAAHGSLSMEVATGSTAGTTRAIWGSSAIGTISGTTGWFREYLYFTANPGAACKVFSFNPTSGICMQVEVSTTGKLVVRQATGSIVTTSTASIPLNAWFRIEGFVTCSATVGQTELKIFSSNMDGTTADETDTSAANLNTNATVLNTANIGMSGTATANIGPYWIDDVAVSDGGYIGPVSSPAQTVNLPVAAITVAAPVPTVSLSHVVNLPVAGITVSAPIPTATVPHPPSRVGAFITPTPNGATWISGSGQTAQAAAEAAWTADAGRPITAERFYLGQQAMPTTTPAAVTNALNNGRRCLISYKPIINPSKLTSGNNLAPLSNTSTLQSTLDGEVNSLLSALNASLTSAGLDQTYIVIDLWQEPYTVGHIGQTGKSTFGDFVDMFRYYGPKIQAAGFKVVWCTSAGNGVAQHGEDATYPGDAWVDIVATDYYTGAYQTGSRLSGYDPNGGGGGNTSQYNPFYRGDNANPPKPCSIYETGGTLVLNDGITVTNFVAYMKGAFQHRASLNLPMGDIAWFNSGNDANNSPITSADGTTHSFNNDGDTGKTEVRNALFASLFDAFDQSATGVGLPCAQLTVAAPAPTVLVGGVTRSLPVSQEAVAAPAPTAVVGVALPVAQEAVAAPAPTAVVGVSLPRISNSIAGQPPATQVGSTTTPLTVAAETIAAPAPTAQVGPVSLALTTAHLAMAPHNPTGVQAGPVSVSLPRAAVNVAALTPTLKTALTAAKASVTASALAPTPALSLSLPVARVNISAPAPTASVVGKVVPITTSALNVGAQPPAISMSAGLAVASETVAAPAPTIGVSCALPTAAQSVVALPLTIGVPVLVSLSAARVTAAAYAPTLATGGTALDPIEVGGSVVWPQTGGSVSSPVTGGSVT